MFNLFSSSTKRERGGCKVSFQLSSDISQERRACRLLLQKEMGQILLSLKCYCSQTNHFILIFAFTFSTEIGFNIEVMAKQ